MRYTIQSHHSNGITETIHTNSIIEADNTFKYFVKIYPSANIIMIDNKDNSIFQQTRCTI